MLAGTKFNDFWPIIPAKKGHLKVYIIVVCLQEHQFYLLDKKNKFYMLA